MQSQGWNHHHHTPQGVKRGCSSRLWLPLEIGFRRKEICLPREILEKYWEFSVEGGMFGCVCVSLLSGICHSEFRPWQVIYRPFNNASVRCSKSWRSRLIRISSKRSRKKLLFDSSASKFWIMTLQRQWTRSWPWISPSPFWSYPLAMMQRRIVYRWTIARRKWPETFRLWRHRSRVRLFDWVWSRALIQWGSSIFVYRIAQKTRCRS